MIRPFARNLALLGCMLTGCARSPDSGAASTWNQPEPAASAAASPRPALPEAVPALDTHTLGWELGTRYAYRLKSTTVIALGSGGNAFDFDLTSRAEIVPAFVTPEKATLFLSMRDAQIVSRVAGSQPALDQVATELRRAACFVTLTGGLVTEVRLPKGLSPMVATAYRDLGARLQVARAAGDEQHYQATEYDTTGRYIADYEFDRESEAWHKRKQRYTALIATENANLPLQLVPQIVASSGELRLSGDGRPENIKAHEEVSVNGAQAPVRSAVTVSLEYDGATPLRAAEPDWSALLAATELLPASRPYGAAAPIDALDRARIDGLKFEQVVERLEQIARQRADQPRTPATQDASLDSAERARQEKNVQEDSRLFLALGAIFRQQPATVLRALQKIRAQSPAADVLVDALGSASSPASEKALAQLIDSNRIDPKQRSRAVTALARAPRPTDDSIRELKAIALRAADPSRTEALFGLGTYARRLRDDGEASRTNALGSFLLARLDEAQGEVGLINVLRAIGNSGYTPALLRVASYLTDEREQVRVVAVRALQSMRDPKIDPMLASHLQSDSSSDVRISAILASQVREPSDTLADALASAALKGADPRVRYRAVELMIHWLPRRPELHAAIDQVARADQEPRVRELAKAAL